MTFHRPLILCSSEERALPVKERKKNGRNSDVSKVKMTSPVLIKPANQCHLSEYSSIRALKKFNQSIHEKKNEIFVVKRFPESH